MAAVGCVIPATERYAGPALIHRPRTRTDVNQAVTAWLIAPGASDRTRPPRARPRNPRPWHADATIVQHLTRTLSE